MNLEECYSEYNGEDSSKNLRQTKFMLDHSIEERLRSQRSVDNVYSVCENFNKFYQTSETDPLSPANRVPIKIEPNFKSFIFESQPQNRRDIVKSSVIVPKAQPKKNSLNKSLRSENDQLRSKIEDLEKLNNKFMRENNLLKSRVFSQSTGIEKLSNPLIRSTIRRMSSPLSLAGSASSKKGVKPVQNLMKRFSLLNPKNRSKKKLSESTILSMLERTSSQIAAILKLGIDSKTGLERKASKQKNKKKVLQNVLDDDIQRFKEKLNKRLSDAGITLLYFFFN